jgi:hypothetical protein
MAALTQARLKELLHYDSETGVFKWRVTRGRILAGTEAGTLRDDGHVQICVDYALYGAHQLAWLYVHGYIPAQIDHRDTDGANNRIGNLREATTAQNNWNVGLKASNTSGVKGVHWCASMGKWAAAIRCNGKKRHLGLFDNLEDAKAAYTTAADQLHGEFANHG